MQALHTRNIMVKNFTDPQSLKSVVRYEAARHLAMTNILLGISAMEEQRKKLRLTSPKGEEKRGTKTSNKKGLTFF